MNKYQIAKLDSYNLVVQVAQNDKTTTDSIPSFAKAMDRLKAITIILGDMKAEQEKNITGIAEDKSNVQEDLCDYLLDIAGALHSYASDKNDVALMAIVDFRPNLVEKMLQADIISSCETVKKEAAKVPAADLAKEGVTAEELVTFSELLEEYKKIKPAPREAIIGRATQTVNIKDLFIEAHKLIKNRLNRLATQFKRKNPDYYLNYKAALNIIYQRSSNKPGEKTNLV